MSWADLKPENRRLAKEILTHRQLRVLQHRLDGHSWNTIAKALSITRPTAMEHFEAAIRNLERHVDVFKESA